MGVFKPWWNVFYGQSLFAGIGLSEYIHSVRWACYYKISLQYGQGNESPRPNLSYLLIGLLLLILSSGEEKRIIVQENEGKIGNANDTTEAGNNVAQEEERSQINDTASAEEGIDNLIRKMSLFTDPTSFNTQITTRTTKTTSYEKFGMIFSLYMLVLFCSMYLTEIAFNR